MTYIEEYYNKIMSDKIVACKRIKQVYKMLVDKLQNSEKYDPWVFDEELANRPIEFIETFCKQAQGELGGALKLQLFQKAKHQAVFGFVNKETRFRQYQEVLDIRGRKNGKTTELAADETFMLVGDDEGSPECYIIATKLDQSKKGFNECYKMIQQSPDLNKHLKKRKSDIYCPFNYGSLQALASNSKIMAKINIKGPIISSAQQWIYDWFGIEATSPAKVSKVLDSIMNNEDLEVEINSCGGDISAGSEIYTAIRGYTKGNKKANIVGSAYSQVQL